MRKVTPCFINSSILAHANTLMHVCKSPHSNAIAMHKIEYPSHAMPNPTFPPVSYRITVFSSKASLCTHIYRHPFQRLIFFYACTFVSWLCRICLIASINYSSIALAPLSSVGSRRSILLSHPLKYRLIAKDILSQALNHAEALPAEILNSLLH